ncbi:MAG TPA: DUF1801 domain-containing protein [Bacteroidia bacterium]|nr:DUF1801 domain-containing protein [Bacteroidia bacterium]HNT80986.1 DUF1801 domain-containing protein [Bacteroidia bacterium]
MDELKKQKAPKFRSVDELIDYLPENELKVFNHLRHIIFDSLPHVKEKLSYNVPFYYGRKRICFLWPGSVPWGSTVQSGVQMGLCYGSLLNQYGFYFTLEKRKWVTMKTFLTLEEIDSSILQSCLWEADTIDKL